MFSRHERPADGRSVPSPSTPFLARVSRHDLAGHRLVWLSTGWMFVFISIATLGLSFAPLGYDQPPLWAFSGALGLIGLLHLRTHPPAVDSPMNHVSLASVWGAVGIGLFVFAPAAVLVLPPAMFIASTTAARLLHREQIAAHFTLATLLMLLPVALGTVDQQTTIGVVAILPAMWVLGFCTVFVLEVAEAQGRELEQLVRRDPLTGVGNRRMLMEELAIELERHARGRRPLSVIALDLNGFKSINDRFGHAAGDDLLRSVAAALVRVTGDQGIVVRQGGDEFCVILPNTSPEVAERHGNAIRAELARVPLESGSVTTGVDIASFPRDAVHSGVLLHVADERLIAHKEGRTAIGSESSTDAAPSDRGDNDLGSPLHRYAG